MSEFEEEIEKLSISEQIALLTEHVDKKFEAIMVIGELYYRLKIAAEQQLLNEAEQESLYNALVSDVNGNDWSFLIGRDDYRDAIFTALPDLAARCR